MTFQVWHKDAPHFLDNDPDALRIFPDGWTHVADVETDHVGAVFQLTNHIDAPFWENDGVKLTPAAMELRGPRSTSVGDVIVGDDGRWSVAGIGLTKF